MSPELWWKLDKRLETMDQELNILHTNIADRIISDANRTRAMIHELKRTQEAAANRETHLSDIIDTHVATMAELHQILADLETKLTNASWVQSPDTKRRNCNCCFTELGSARCSLGHYICLTCIDTECLFRREDDRPLVAYSMPCLACGCEGIIGSDIMRMTEHGRMLVSDFDIQQHMPFFLKHMHRTPVELTLIRSDHTFRGHACPRCGFGPMLLSNCPDLRTHQDDPVAGNVRIDNRCPRCNAFTKNCGDMPRWKGSQPHVSHA